MNTRVANKIVNDVSGNGRRKYTHDQIGRAMDKLYRRMF